MKLSSWQRMTLIGLLGGLQGDLGVIYTGSKILDKISLSDADRVDNRVVQVGSAVQWDGDLGIDVMFTEQEKELVRSTIERHRSWSLNAPEELFDLCEKFGVEFETDD